LVLGATVGFEQATIKVEKQQEYGALQAVVEDAFQSQQVEKFLKQMDRKGVRVRDFDGVLAKKVLESVVSAKVNAGNLYQALTLSDQAQMREFYLSKLEGVDVALRHKFKKLYQYY
jgi:ACT domain-containing protein